MLRPPGGWASSFFTQPAADESAAVFAPPPTSDPARHGFPADGRRACRLSVPSSAQHAVNPRLPRLPPRQAILKNIHMQYLRWGLGFALCYALSFAATFGTVVPVLGGASDLVVDEGRGRLYLVNTSQNRVDVYSLQQRRLHRCLRNSRLPASASFWPPAASSQSPRTEAISSARTFPPARHASFSFTRSPRARCSAHAWSATLRRWSPSHRTARSSCPAP